MNNNNVFCGWLKTGRKKLEAELAVNLGSGSLSFLRRTSHPPCEEIRRSETAALTRALAILVSPALYELENPSTSLIHHSPLGPCFEWLLICVRRFNCGYVCIQETYSYRARVRRRRVSRGETEGRGEAKLSPHLLAPLAEPLKETRFPNRFRLSMPAANFRIEKKKKPTDSRCAVEPG